MRSGRIASPIASPSVDAAEEETRGWWELGVPRTAAGIDDLLGRPSDRGRGLGSVVLRAFTDDVVLAGHPAWTHACASPRTANVASWRALAKAGFTQAGDFPTEHGPARRMVRARHGHAWPGEARGRRPAPGD